MIKLLSLIILCFYLATGTPVSVSEKCFQTPLSLSSNDFGFQLVKQLGAKDKNLFVSPLSLYAALAMAHRGAGGRTAEQLEAVLKLKKHQLEGTKLQESFQKLLLSFREKKDSYSLLVANALFAQDGFHMNSQYLKDLHKFYMAALKLVDFERHGEAAKNTINQWVAENTNNKIKNLLSASLNGAVLAIFNAVYFNGTWKTQFNKRDTRDDLFFISGRENNKIVSFMKHPNKKFMYYHDSEAKYSFLELPYKGRDIAMLFALPENVNQTADLEMTTTRLCRIKSNLKRINLDKVLIPKFHLEYQNEMSSVLFQLGIKDIFTSAANLTGISPDGNLVVSKVVHKAVIDVNEEGSEVAAVSGVIMTKMSMLTRVKQFVANHPFLFYIVHKRSGLVLFVGRVVNPS